jgi:GDSL/SGNH-like Acyl-Esterase family found in Pmr5 and Cas1p
MLPPGRWQTAVLPSLLLLLTLSMPGQAVSPGACGSSGKWVKRHPSRHRHSLPRTNNCTEAERHLDQVWLPTQPACSLLDWDVSSNALAQVLSPLHGARLLLAGDSLVQQLFLALRSLLEAEVVPFPSEDAVHMPGEQAADGQRQAVRSRLHATAHNITLDYMRNNVLGEHFNGALVALAARYDHILVSAGTWYNEVDSARTARINSTAGWRPRHRAEFEQDVRGFGSAISALGLQAQFFWLQPTPQHFVGGGSFHGKLTTSCEERKPEDVTRARWRSDVARESLAGSGLTILETFEALDPLYDSHPFNKIGRKDCTHFCLVGAAQLFQCSLILSHLLWVERGS